MMKVLTWQFFISILLTMACSHPNESDKKANLPYFDLSGFIKTNTKDSLSIPVEKSITINGAVESKQIEQYAIWKDLRDFDTYDINRPALYDKYLIDTVQDATMHHIVYTPVNDQLKVRLLSISYAADKIRSIKIKAATKSFLENVSLEIDWQLGQGYMINRQSDRLFKSDSSIQVVEVKIL